jgi:hypothetical protein
VVLVVLAWGLVAWKALLPPIEVPVPSLGLDDMVLAPAGILERRAPRVDVAIDAFYIDRFEVTRGEYAEFLRDTGHPHLRLEWPGATPPRGTEEWPVTLVTLHDARAYADWRGKRLPTSNEWEWAARGSLNLAWPWGGAIQKSVANTAELDYRSLTPVGLFEGGVSPLGAYDMVGNAAEWTEGPVAATGVEIEDRFFIRGGSFLQPLRSSEWGDVLETHHWERLPDGPGAWVLNREFLGTASSYASNVGFRCALDASLIEDERRIRSLIQRLGARDPVGYLLEVRPAMSELHRRGVAAARALDRASAEGIDAAARRRLLREMGADVLGILAYCQAAVPDESVKERIQGLIARIERDAARSAGSSR